MGRNHIAIDARDCSGSLNDVLTVTEFLNHVAGMVEGKILQSPIVVNKGNGLIGMMLLNGSHIVLHTNNQDKNVSFDVYSNKMFDKIKVRNFFMKYFSVAIGSLRIVDVGSVKGEVVECEVPHCVNPANREWRGRHVCQDHYDELRDKEFEARRMDYH